MNSVADPRITFDSNGLCNHCRRYDELLPSRVLRGDVAQRALDELVSTIKAVGRGNDYDCLVGVSGGVDSTYVAYLVKQYGLRPLAVHLDNGWDSELAVKNIERVLKILGIDLYTCVLDWEEFRDLQVAFLKASTPDGEIPSDHAIFALLWKEAARRNIRYIISGMNFATEAMSVPDWAYGHSDWRYIRDVYRRFGAGRLRSYPHFTLLDLLWWNGVRGVKTVSILNYIDYQKDNVMQLLTDKLGWVYYGGKHYESVYTRFWQGYVLPNKFGIDKRVGHYSDLINSGQMMRTEALEQIKLPPYPEKLASEDRRYVIKKLRVTESEFDAFMSAPPKTYRDYRNNAKWVELLKRLVTLMREHGLYSR
jgi:N-acetyl sugar amidotransferase